MAKSAGQKLKLLYLKDILLRETDEEHPMNASDIEKKLSEYNIEAGRKSIYDDVECLEDYGLDIIKAEGRRGGYYVGARDFELAELKLLADAVASSRFITARKSETLIKKISSLASVFDEDRLKRQVYSLNRVKSENESILITVDIIHEAIRRDKDISFLYLAWTPDKKLEPKHNGKRYRISPEALIWDDENYYLAGYDRDDEKRKHFRADKISRAEILDETRYKEYPPLDVAEYSKSVFGMFPGKLSPVTIRCPENKIGIFLDRFGTQITISKQEQGVLNVHIHASLSGQFFGWLLSLGDDVSLVGPREVRDEYAEFLRKALDNYRDR